MPKTSDDEHVICPYCGKRHGDAWEWVTEKGERMKCDKCGKTFVYWAEADVTYYARDIEGGQALKKALK